MAVAANIEKMFVQLQVPHKDRSALRSLWSPGDNVHDELAEFRVIAQIVRLLGTMPNS